MESKAITPPPYFPHKLSLNPNRVCCANASQRSWQQWHGWWMSRMRQLRERQCNNTGRERYFYPLPRAWTGRALVELRDMCLFVGSERTDEGIQRLEASTHSGFWLHCSSHDCRRHRSLVRPWYRNAGLGCVISASPSSPQRDTSRLSHADDPHTITCTPTKHSERSEPAFKWGIYWHVEKHKSRRARPMSLSGELITTTVNRRRGVSEMKV